MTIIGCDYSPEYQPGFQVRAVRDAGMQFIAVKVSDSLKGTAPYDTGIDVLREARSLGMPAVGYHYIRTGKSAEDHAAMFASQLKAAGVPGMLDLEFDGVTMDDYREILLATHEVGARVAFSYIPQWFSIRLGSPSLRGVPPLWASHYVAGVGTPTDLLAMVPSSWWTPYGGRPDSPAILQYAANRPVGGFNVDLNAYPGTVGSLLRRLGQ